MNIDWGRRQAAAVRTAEHMARARAEATMRIIAAIDATADRITGVYPVIERAMWPDKAAAARAMLAGKPTADQRAMLAAEAAGTGEALPALAARVSGRAAAFATLAGHLAGIRGKAAAEIAAAATEDAVDQIVSAVMEALHGY